MKCLAKEPSRRYESASALADDLERFVQRRPIVARPVGTIERAWRWCQRRPAVASLMALAVTLMIVGTAVSVHFAVKANARARDAFENLYATRMNQLQQEWDSGNHMGRTADQLLALAPEQMGGLDLRGFEWNYLWTQSHSELLTFHGDHSLCLAFSPDGTRLASIGRYNGELKIWDTATTKEVLSIITDREAIKAKEVFSTDVAYSPTGKQIATAEVSGKVKLWDASSGSQLFVLDGHTSEVRSIAFNHDGTRLVTGGGVFFQPGELKVWDVTDGREILDLPGHHGRVESVAFSPDGSRLASVSSYASPNSGLRAEVKIWNASTGRELLSIKDPAAAAFNSVSFSPNGKTIATAAHNTAETDKTVKLWEVATGDMIRAFQGHTESTYCVAFSSDGRRLASCGRDKTIRILDVSTGQTLLSIKGDNENLAQLAFTPDGRRIAGTAGRDVKLWDAWIVPELGKYSVAEMVLGNWQTCFEFKAHTNPVNAVATSRDGRLLATGCTDTGNGDAEIKVWDLQTRQKLFALAGHNFGVSSVAFSSDGQWLASASVPPSVSTGERKSGEPIQWTPGELKIWNMTTGEETHALLGHSNGIGSVAFSPDATRLASGSADQTVRIWDVATGEHLRTLPCDGQVWSVVFSPDGIRLATGRGWDPWYSKRPDRPSTGEIQLWDVATGKRIKTFETNQAWVNALAFSPDGERLVAGLNGHSDNLRVWDVATGEQVLTLNGHTRSLSAVTFSPDGKRIATAGGDRTARIWHASSGQLLLTLPVYKEWPVRCIAFTPDGSRLVTSGDSIVKIWDARPPSPELSIERDAVSLLHFLDAKGILKPAVIESIRADKTISEAVRAKALSLTEHYSPAAAVLNKASRLVVRNPDETSERYHVALRQIQQACRIRPNQSYLLNTLGIAYYRVGQYQQAVEALRKADTLDSFGYSPNGSHPADLAFLAMSQFQLGQRPQARETLSQLQKLMQDSRWAKHAESQAFLREVESLVGPSTFPEPSGTRD